MIFGDAGAPLFHFDVRLGFGYFFSVAVWETRRLMCGAACIETAKSEKVHGVTSYPKKKKSRRVATVHLCLPALDEGTQMHEVFHALREYERRVKRRYRSEHAREEAMAQQIETCVLAMRSHIAEELRIMR